MKLVFELVGREKLVTEGKEKKSESNIKIIAIISLSLKLSQALCSTKFNYLELIILSNFTN